MSFNKVPIVDRFAFVFHLNTVHGSVYMDFAGA
jgi:hypothetical protein